MPTGLNLDRFKLITDFEILSGTDERNRHRNMSFSEFIHCVLELSSLTDYVLSIQIMEEHLNLITLNYILNFEISTF